MLRRIKWVDTTDDAFDPGGTEIGAGLNFTSNVKFTQNDTGRFAFVFGQGIQNYMNDAPVDVGIELTPGGDPRLGFGRSFIGSFELEGTMWSRRRRKSLC